MGGFFFFFFFFFLYLYLYGHKTRLVSKKMRLAPSFPITNTTGFSREFFIGL